jgi:hypothetical protein
MIVCYYVSRKAVRMNSSKNQKIQAAGAIFVIAAIIIIGALATRTKSTQTVATRTAAKDTSTNTAQTSNQTCSTITANTTFKDGTYAAVGSYTSPGGSESIKVNLTLSDNVVTAATVTSGANDPTASSYQGYFISGYKPSVVGKKISTIKLSNVSGSSLTSQGFNQALQKVECHAEQA